MGATGTEGREDKTLNRRQQRGGAATKSDAVSACRRVGVSASAVEEAFQ